MNVLIVDDSALARGIIRRTLQDHGKGQGLAVTEAANGEEAWKALESTKVDLVFIDWNMPVLDGLGFVKKAREKGVDTPIVMITAVSDEARILEACQAGVSEYVQKPIQPSALWERIKGYVK